MQVTIDEPTTDMLTELAEISGLMPSDVLRSLIAASWTFAAEGPENASGARFLLNATNAALAKAERAPDRRQRVC